MKGLFCKKIICVKSGTRMSDADTVMKSHSVRHLPVVDNDDRVTGILTSHDIKSHEAFHHLPVDMFTSYPVKTVSSETPLSEVALRMVQEKVSCFIISDNQEATGIVTSDDLLLQYSLLMKYTESQKDRKHNL